MISKFFLLLFLGLFTSTAFGIEQFDDIIEEILPKTKLTNEQLKHLREELKVQKMFIEGVKQIELSGGEFVNLEKSTDTVHDLLVSSIGAKTTNVTTEIKNQVEDIVKQSINRNGIKNALIKSKEFAFGFANDKKIFMSSIARRFGFDIGVVYIASLQVDLTFPMIMIASGQPQYAALLATPVSSIVTGSFAAVKSAVKFRQVVKMLGGIGNTIDYFGIVKEARSFFNRNFFLKYDLLDFNYAGKTFVLTVERQNLISKMMSKLGFNNQLNYQNLLALMDENEFMPKLVESLKSSDRPEEVKLLRLINKIQSTGDEKIIAALENRFGKFMHEMSDLPNFSSQRNWAVKIAHSQNFDQFITHLMHMPDDIPPQVFDRIWRNYVLQNSSKTIGPYMNKDTYTAFRELFDGYDTTLRKDFMTSVETHINIDMKARLTDYFYKSLGNMGICGHLFKKRGDVAPLL